MWWVKIGKSISIHLEIHIFRGWRNQSHQSYFPLWTQFKHLLFWATSSDFTSLGSVPPPCALTPACTCPPIEHLSTLLLLRFTSLTLPLHQMLSIFCCISGSRKVEIHKIATFLVKKKRLDISNFIWLNLIHGRHEIFCWLLSDVWHLNMGSVPLLSLVLYLASIVLSLTYRLIYGIVLTVFL